MDKRGVAITISMMEILAGLFFGAIVVPKAIELANQEAFYRNYVAEDLVLAIHTVLASPGDVAINYTGNLSKYVLDIKNNELQVYKQGDVADAVDKEVAKSFITRKTIIGIGEVTLPEKIVEPRALVIAKIGDRLIISDKVPVAVRDLWQG